MENPMQIELRCRRCASHFSAPPDTPYGEVLDRMIDEGPWFGLAEGDTFEDMIFAALATRGVIRCPDCSRPVAVGEQSLARAAYEAFSCN
jgi:hypothetical protein